MTMTKTKTARKTKDQKKQESIDKLLFILNQPETGCTFWKIEDPDAHIMGIRPITRTTIEIVNENGFNPYDRKKIEHLFKCFKVLIVNKKEEIKTLQEEITKKNEIEKNGIIYIKHHDLLYIFENIKNSK